MAPAVIFATESAPSTTEYIARAICVATAGTLHDLASADVRQLLSSGSPLLFVMPTYDGQPPSSAEPLLAELGQCSLSDVAFSVYGVGDNTYCDWFNCASEQLVAALLSAGGLQLAQLEKGDIQQLTGAGSGLAEWLRRVCAALGIVPINCPATAGTLPIHASGYCTAPAPSQSSTLIQANEPSAGLPKSEKLEEEAVRRAASLCSAVVEQAAVPSRGAVVGKGRLLVPYTAVPSFKVAAQGNIQLQKEQFDTILWHHSLAPKLALFSNRLVGLTIVGFEVESHPAIDIDRRTPVVGDPVWVLIGPSEPMWQASICQVAKDASSFEIIAEEEGAVDAEHTSHGCMVLCARSGLLMGLTQLSEGKQMKVGSASKLVEKLLVRSRCSMSHQSLAGSQARKQLSEALNHTEVKSAATTKQPLEAPVQDVSAAVTDPQPAEPQPSDQAEAQPSKQDPVDVHIEELTTRAKQDEKLLIGLACLFCAVLIRMLFKIWT